MHRPLRLRGLEFLDGRDDPKPHRPPLHVALVEQRDAVAEILAFVYQLNGRMAG